MKASGRSIGFVLAALVLIGSVTFVAQRVWRDNGLRALQAVNEPRVQLVANTVKAEINRQDHLPVVLSLDSDVQQALAAPDDAALGDRLNRKLKRISQEADTRALYVIAASGTVRASDDFDTPDSLVGRDLRDRPYFQVAAATGKSSFLGVEPSSNRVRYYVANAIGAAPLLGVAVVRIEFDRIESAWEMAREQVLVTDSRGIVFLASDSSYKYRQLRTVGSSPAFDEESLPGQYPQGAETAIEFTVLERRGGARIVKVPTPDGPKSYLYQSLSLPDYGWTIHRLADLSIIEADQRDGTIIGAAISIIAVSGLFFVRQRQRALIQAQESSSRLSSEVAERTSELRKANAALHAEVEERRSTEEMLRTTQNTLLQAGKLAALGQMSTAIAHEINQPLAAIRTFIASTRIYSSRGDVEQVTTNLTLIDGLAERMANITSHLKTFARKSDGGRAETVDVERAVAGALLLMESQIRLAEVFFQMRLQPKLFVRGNAVQLEQVLVNLLQNALHAVADARQPIIRLETVADQDIVQLIVTDNGPGIPAQHLDQIFDPFFTTKPIGKGLGLGLSISYGIVGDFGGRIRAENLPAGGVEMIVELPRYHPESGLPDA